MSQTEDHPGSRLRQKCVGGVMDGELSQQRSAAGLRRASAGHLAAVSAPFFSLLSLSCRSPELRRLAEMTQGVKQAIAEPSGLLFHG